jgi:two-component system, OmpR family, phosphate regulon sensor histidine kinase PhoR
LKSQFKSEINLLLLSLAFSFLAGLTFGRPTLGLLCGLIGYLIWTLHQARKLDKWLAKPNRSKKPELTGIYAHLMDRVIRLQRQQDRESQLLRSSLERQNLLIEEVRDAVILIDERDRIKWFNRAAASLIHLDPDKDLAVPIIGAIRNAAFHAYLDGGDYSQPKRICLDESSKSWLEISVTDYDIHEKLLVIRDASAVQELEDMRRDFIANLSHELRTPVTVLVGYLETLELQDPENPATSRIHKEMEKQCERISALLKDLLTLSRLEAWDAKQPSTAINISPLLEQIANEAPGLKEFDNHVLTLKIQPDIRVMGSSSDMLSAFSNLVYNAVRHTPPGTEIIIRAKSKGGVARVEIIDRGLGIERHHLHRLTERFYRIESSRNSETGGTGLGLAIVKHALGRSGGKLKIESTLGKGSSFRCLLPLAPEENKKDQADAEAELLE